MKVVKDLDRPRVWGVEGVNQLGSSVSYSPPRIGGVAAHQENAAKPPLKAQTGWSVQNDHPVRAFLTFLMARPPLLFQEGPMPFQDQAKAGITSFPYVSSWLSSSPHMR